MSRINKWESPTIRATNMDNMYRKVLEKIYKYGAMVDEVKDPLSVTTEFGKNPMGSKELLEATCILSNPRARLITNHIRPLNIYFAVGQFLWYMNGSNDANAIGYYNPRANEFAENGKIGGNAYGYRMLNVPNGKSQLHTILGRLSSDKYSRRAFIPIYIPDDNIGTGKEVPCPIGVQLIYRFGLNLILKMRSNNALTLFPYNVFSFSMLQELCAVNLDMKMGNFILNAISLHTLNKDLESSENVMTASPSQEMEMIAMPNTKDIRPILEFEDYLRKETIIKRKDMDIIEWADKTRGLGNYWGSIAMVLVAYSAQKIGKFDLITDFLSGIDPSLAYFIRLSSRRRF